MKITESIRQQIIREHAAAIGAEGGRIGGLSKSPAKKKAAGLNIRKRWEMHRARVAAAKGDLKTNLRRAQAEAMLKK